MPAARRFLAVAALLLAASPALGQEKPLLRWGTDPIGGGPYVYEDGAGKETGFEWDLAAYLADKIGRRPEMRKGDWSKLPQLLDRPADAAGAIDIVLNGYEKTDELEKQYASTIPYYAYRLQLLTRENTGIAGWNDLLPAAGRPPRTVGVLEGTVAFSYMQKKYGDRIALSTNPDVATVMGEVADKERLDATVQDNPAATYYLGTTPKLRAAGPPVQPGFYVIYLRKTDTDLRDKLNAAIRDGLKDGTLQRVYRKYGLWSPDQEWLCYTQTGEWPADVDALPADDSTAGNPWPRMLSQLAGAAGMTVLLSVTSFPLAMLLGMLVALGRVYGPWLVRTPLGVYVEVLRGTPLLLQLYFIFYLLPSVGIALDPLAAGILGLAVNYSAYEAENYRAGLLAVPRGQMEAALSLGMTPLTAVRRVVVPQAVRVVIPPVTNDFIALFKDTSVCSVILITELTRKYNELYNFNRGYIVELAFVTAGLYLLMSYPLALLAGALERRVAVTRGGRP